MCGTKFLLCLTPNLSNPPNDHLFTTSILNLVCWYDIRVVRTYECVVCMGSGCGVVVHFNKEGRDLGVSGTTCEGKP